MFRQAVRQDLRLSKYNTARGGIDVSLIRPPFDFSNTMVRIFPLRARMERVQSFVNQYLNIVPEAAGHFRAYLPFIYLSFIHYGKMSLTAANLGWLSQYEVVFAVPLLWYKRVGDRLVFHDFATVAPFIYVDNDHSMTTGREVYGWPKNRITADSVLASWMKDPEANPTVASFRSTMFSQLYMGSRPRPRVFFEIRQTVGASLGRWPFNPGAPWLPWTSLPQSITSSLELMQDYGEILRGLGFTQQQRGAGLDSYARMMARTGRELRPYQPEFVFNTLNLKQFRDAEHPHLAAYQALTNAPMKWNRIWRGGLLGDVRLLQGDSTGGFSVDLYHSPTAPIVDLLGLEVAGERTIGDTTVHILHPTFPMWLDVDMQYNLARTIAWSVKGQPWRDGQGKSMYVPGEHCIDTDTYNNARGAADMAVAGPFEFPKTTLRVMPLLADPKRLWAFLQEYLGDALTEVGVQIAPWGRYVYLIATSYQEMSSATNDIGWWADRELAFHVPAVLKKGGELWKIVLVPAYVYANSITAAQTGAEVSGIPVQHAFIESTNNTWMDDLGTESWKRRTLLKMSTTLLPAADMGQEISQRLFLEVIGGDLVPANQQGLWLEIAQKWGVTLKRENERKRAMTGESNSDEDEKVLDATMVGSRQDLLNTSRAFALQVLTRQRPIRMLTLKQFRDADDPADACYQAIVEIRREITAVHEIEEIESGLYVRIQQYPTQPIVERLGLIPIREEYEPGGMTAHVLEPIRPFWMRVSLKEHLGRNLFVRTAPGEWLRDTEPREFAPTPVGLRLPRGLQYSIDEPRALLAFVREEFPKLEKEVRENKPRDKSLGRIFESEKDLANIVAELEPQCILESILSEEWERWHGCRWTRVQADLMRRSDAVRRGKMLLDAAVAEFDFFLKLISAHKKNTPPEYLYIGYYELAELLRHRLSHCYYLQRSLEGSAATAKGAEDAKRAAEEDKEYELRYKKKLSEIKELQKTKNVFKYNGLNLKKLKGANVAAKLQHYALRIEVFHRNVAMFLAKAEGKPYHVVKRASIANRTVGERLFEKDSGWDDDWYEGAHTKRKSGI